MLLCVALGAGVVGYVMLEARREGRGDFWTPEGEELIAGARRTGEKVRSRSEELGRSAAARTQALREKRRADGTDEAPRTDETAVAAPGASGESDTSAAVAQPAGQDEESDEAPGEFRAAS